ncbi:MAG: aspartate-semialdehyde dehydrogenase [Deltaproteobacteria bacterium]|nr:aspartate-semialdehyde dehydrogenase [Deltaproteobacteria bacterium]
MRKPPCVAVAGVTGAVGQEFLRILAERRFPFSRLTLLASARSAGKPIEFQGRTYVVEELTERSFDGVDLALFSAGGAISRRFAPIAAQQGCVVVDNSSAFRMDPNVPLVVPEVNPQDIAKHRGIIANPNCSTIIMNVVVWPLHQAAGVRRAVVSTYQAASGAGAAAMRELEQQAHQWSRGEEITSEIFQRQYVWNLFSHNSKIDAATGYNEEELKMLKETRKIFHDDTLRVTATCVRVPVLRAHCESINLTFARPLDEEHARKILAEAPGVRVIDDREANRHPEPLHASGKDDVFVGRIRRDLSQDDGYGLDLFVSGDQIRKGAALNAIQIAEHLLATA